MTSNKQTINIEAYYDMVGTLQVEIPEDKKIEQIFIKWNRMLIEYTDGTSEEFDDLDMSFEDGDTKRPFHIRAYDEDYADLYWQE